MTGYLFVYILKKVKQQTKNIENFSGDFSITELKKTDLTFSDHSMISFRLKHEKCIDNTLKQQSFSNFKPSQ